jgi:hypothetical protein
MRFKVVLEPGDEGGYTVYTNHDSKGHVLYANIYGRVKHGL